MYVYIYIYIIYVCVSGINNHLIYNPVFHMPIYSQEPNLSLESIPLRTADLDGRPKSYHWPTGPGEAMLTQSEKHMDLCVYIYIYVYLYIHKYTYI